MEQFVFVNVSKQTKASQVLGQYRASIVDAGFAQSQLLTDISVRMCTQPEWEFVRRMFGGTIRRRTVGEVPGQRVSLCSDLGLTYADEITPAACLCWAVHGHRLCRTPRREGFTADLALLPTHPLWELWCVNKKKLLFCPIFHRRSTENNLFLALPLAA